jgi:hypothetical protein
LATVISKPVAVIFSLYEFQMLDLVQSPKRVICFGWVILKIEFLIKLLVILPCGAPTNFSRNGTRK